LDPRIHVPSSRNSLSLASLNYGQVSRSKMDPRPDHGEQSYKGSGRLAGRKALITGGDSGMGRAAAIAYAREVIEIIKAEGRKAIALPGDLRDEAFCKRLVADTVNALGGLDIVVNNAGRQQSHESIEDIPPSSLTGQ
jgi:short-subunit dehydrogenase